MSLNETLSIQPLINPSNISTLESLRLILTNYLTLPLTKFILLIPKQARMVCSQLVYNYYI